MIISNLFSDDICNSNWGTPATVNYRGKETIFGVNDVISLSNSFVSNATHQILNSVLRRLPKECYDYEQCFINLIFLVFISLK